jgi:hypothetical protein
LLGYVSYASLILVWQDAAHKLSDAPSFSSTLKRSQRKGKNHVKFLAIKASIISYTSASTIPATA